MYCCVLYCTAISYHIPSLGVCGSVTYDPSKLMAYAAWENGADESWTPAACNTYLVLDMSKWFLPATH